jgi:hypothetical protein
MRGDVALACGLLASALGAQTIERARDLRRRSNRLAIGDLMDLFKL